MEEVGFDELVEDLWDSRRTLPLPGMSGTGVFAGIRLKLWDSHWPNREIHSGSRVTRSPKLLTRFLGEPISFRGNSGLLPRCQAAVGCQ